MRGRNMSQPRCPTACLGVWSGGKVKLLAPVQETQKGVGAEASVLVIHALKKGRGMARP